MRLTSRPTRGPKRITSVHRGVSDFRDCETGRSVLSPDASNHHQLAPSESGLTEQEDPMIYPTEHELRHKSMAAEWNELRDLIQVAVTENEALEDGQLCIVCSESACLRCQPCGPSGFYCSQCFSRAHSEVNYFHVGEKWEVHLNTSW